MGDRGPTIDMDRKEGGGAVPLSWVEELGPRLTQCGLGRGLLPCAKWRLHPFSRLATIEMGQKLVGCHGCVPFRGGGGGTPSNTTSPGPRFTSVLSGILIHPAVLPQ